MGEPAAREALRLQGLGFGILVRLTSAARVARVGGWMGECNSDGRQRDERGNKGWQDDGALDGIPLSVVTFWTRWSASIGSRWNARFAIPAQRADRMLRRGYRGASEADLYE